MSSLDEKEEQQDAGLLFINHILLHPYTQSLLEKPEVYLLSFQTVCDTRLYYHI